MTLDWQSKQIAKHPVAVAVAVAAAAAEANKQINKPTAPNKTVKR